MGSSFTESVVEGAALAWLEAAGWHVLHGPEIAPEMLGTERRDYWEVMLAGRVRDALVRLNPDRPVEAVQDAFRKVMRMEGVGVVQRML